MAVIQKTLFSKNLTNYSVLVNDTQTDSKYFKITQLPDTFTGGKNAFLIAGSEYLVPDTKIQIELVDAAGNIIYHEPGEGMINTNISGSTNTSIITEYFEGVSKVVAVYVYPDTAFGPCTLTILGELSSYESDAGITSIVPLDWENKYNVKWQKQINVNPSLPNTTKIRFYQRPQASITEILNPIYRIESGSKVNSGVSQSFAEIKLSKLETFAGDVKRVKVFRTSQGDISDYDLIQDILVESKELLTSYGLSGSVVGETGILTQETLKNYWNTGSLNAFLTSSRVESGVRLSGGGNFTYTSSLDIKSANTYELNLDAFYSSSTSSNLGIYLISGSTTSSIATLIGTQPTKNLLDTIIPFKVDKDFPSASLYFSQSQGEWHVGNISLKLSQDTAFSPDEISFITTMPTIIGDETYNFKFEFYDVNNTYVPVAVTQSANFTGGNIGKILRSLTLESDRTAFRFSTGSYGNPPFQQLGLSISKTNLTGSVTYGRSVFDTSGNYIAPASYAGTYPGTLTNSSDAGATLTIANFSGSLSSVIVGSIVYTASCDGLNEYETIYRFEDGDNAPGVFVTANTNQFIYKATDLSLNPSGQTITIEAKRKNLASADTLLTINIQSSSVIYPAPPLTLVSTNATNGVDTYTISGTSYPYSTGETIYSISGSDQFGNIFSDAIKISPVKILDGLSVSLTNDNASLPARSNGFVESGSFVLSSGSVSVKVGNEVITHSNGLSTNNRFDIISAVATNVQTGSLTYSTTDYFITRLDADSGSLNLTIRYKDGAGDTSDTTKLVTYTKNKKAAPVLQISSTPKDQTVTAKSTGEQIDAFSNVTISVKQTYDGATTNLTITSLTATSSDIASISTTPSTGLVTLVGKTLANGVNSTTVNITAVVTDSEGISRTITDTLALSKTKKAVPNVVVSATPQAQSVLANAAGVQTGALTNVTVSALEGTTSRFTSMTATYTGFSTNPTISTNTLTTSAAVMNAAEAAATIVVTHTDSEGTTGQTQTIVVRFTKVPTGTAGTPGLNGADGGTGPGVVYRGDWAINTAYFSSSIRVDVVRGSDSEYYLAKVGHTSTGTGALDKPITGTSYTTYWRPFGATFESVATDILLARDATITRGLVMGTYGATDKGFIRSANASALMTGKGYYLDTTGSMRFGDPSGGYIKFTESEGVTIAGSVTISGTATIGGTSATTVKDGAASGATAQQNGSDKTAGKVGGWSVNSNAIYRGTEGADDTYTTNNGDITFGAGWISAKQFKIASNGNATFKGNLTGATGTFSDTVSGATITGGTISIGSSNNIFKADSNGIYLGNATFASAPFRVTPGGALTATNATITGVITAESGFIGTAAAGWSIASNKIFNTNIDIDNANNRIDFKSGGVVKTRIKSGAVNIGSTSTTSVTVSGAGSDLTSLSGNDSPQYGPLTALAYTQGIAQIAYITTPSGVDGNNVALVIPYPSVTSLGFVQCHNMGTGTSCQYAYDAYVNYVVKQGGTGVTVASGYIMVAQLSWSNNFSSPFGNIDLPGFGGGTVTIPSIGTAVSTQVYTIEVYLGTIVQARINPQGTDPLTAAASLYVIAFGWDARTANATLLAVAPRAEFGTNGVQIGSAEGSYVALGDAAGAGNVGVFAGNISVTGTVAAGSVTASDIRAKTNIKTILNGIETIKKLNPVSYDWLQHITGNFEFEKGYGFIADDIQQIMPELIYEKKGYKYDDFKHLDYTSFHAIAIKAIQELTEKVEKLEAQISGSNNQIQEVI